MASMPFPIHTARLPSWHRYGMDHRIKSGDDGGEGGASSQKTVSQSVKFWNSPFNSEGYIEFSSLNRTAVACAEDDDGGFLHCHTDLEPVPNVKPKLIFQ
jgi:hypothetical protein